MTKSKYSKTYIESFKFLAKYELFKKISKSKKIENFSKYFHTKKNSIQVFKFKKVSMFEKKKKLRLFLNMLIIQIYIYVDLYRSLFFP